MGICFSLEGGGSQRIAPPQRSQIPEDPEDEQVESTVLSEPVTPAVSGPRSFVLALPSPGNAAPVLAFLRFGGFLVRWSLSADHAERGILVLGPSIENFARSLLGGFARVFMLVHAWSSRASWLLWGSGFSFFLPLDFGLFRLSTERPIDRHAQKSTCLCTIDLSHSHRLLRLSLLHSCCILRFLQLVKFVQMVLVLSYLFCYMLLNNGAVSIVSTEICIIKSKVLFHVMVFESRLPLFGVIPLLHFLRDFVKKRWFWSLLKPNTMLQLRCWHKQRGLISWLKMIWVPFSFLICVVLDSWDGEVWHHKFCLSHRKGAIRLFG